MGNAFRRTVVALAAIALILGGAWIVWPNPDAPKGNALKPSPSPTRHVAPAIRADLQTDLNELGYVPQKPVTSAVNANEVPSTHQLWTSPGQPQVELNDLGSGIYQLHTISFAGSAGDWKNFWCSPGENEPLKNAINFGATLRKDIAAGTVTLNSDIDTPRGTKFTRWTDLNGQPKLTCYVSNS